MTKSPDQLPAEFEFSDQWAIDFAKLASKKMRERHGEKEKTAAVNDRIIEMAEECLRWRASHDRGKDGFNPDYCAARDALKEHLEYCRPAPELPKDGWIAELHKKLEIVAQVMEMASKDMRPAEPFWHVDFCNAAAERIRQAQALIPTPNNKGE